MSLQEAGGLTAKLSPDKNAAYFWVFGGEQTEVTQDLPDTRNSALMRLDFDNELMLGTQEEQVHAIGFGNPMLAFGTR
jgi:hypothetical protein